MCTRGTVDTLRKLKTYGEIGHPAPKSSQKNAEKHVETNLSFPHCPLCSTQIYFQASAIPLAELVLLEHKKFNDMEKIEYLSEEGEALQKEVVDEQCPIDFKKLQLAMTSLSIVDNAIVYQCLVSSHLRTRIEEFSPQPKMPKYCLDYLLDCIRTEYSIDDGEFVHTRGQACFELGVPLDEYWLNHGCSISEREYWKRIRVFLIDNHPTFFEEIPTHFLEGWPLKEANEELLTWSAEAKLVRYVEHLGL